MFRNVSKKGDQVPWNKEFHRVPDYTIGMFRALLAHTAALPYSNF
jgi:hypothetical protein